MRILLLNQTFYPDLVATAQYLSDLACALADRQHEVTVIASRRAYDNPNTTFAARECWRSIDIHRVANTRLGKSSKLRRAADFASFMLACCWKLVRVHRPDVVVALTSPPLISVIAACYAAVRRCRFIYWVMDLNPDEAIAAGWLRQSSSLARMLGALSEFSLRHAHSVVVLDRFMHQRIAGKGIPAEKLFIVPPWSHDKIVRFDAPGRENFRREHGLSGKFVIMYSGNHSPCHPLDSLLAAADRLRDDRTVAFCFVGGGSEFRKVQQFAAEKRLSNITCLPYQPSEKLAASLSAADLHVVVMGDQFVGTIHPCKIYNVMRVAPAVLYIGPDPSHITDIFRNSTSPSFAAVPNGDSEAIVHAIQRLRSTQFPPATFAAPGAAFSEKLLLRQLVDILESASPLHPADKSGVAKVYEHAEP